VSERADASSKPSSTPADPYTELFTLLEDAVAAGVFPGCVAIVGRGDAIVYHEGHGMLGTHDAFARFEPVVRETIYDLASLTKVLATTTLCALAVSERRLALEDEVPSPWARACPGATLADLLEHCAGLQAHREYFTEVEPFDAEAVLERVCGTPRAGAPRERAIYSDLGFMILGAWLERVFETPLDRLFADRVAFPLGLDAQPLPHAFFRRIESKAAMVPVALERRIAPTEVYDIALHPDGVPSHVPVRADATMAHGVVHDDNAWAMGGVAGHAGLFGDAWGVHEIARAWLHASLPGMTTAVRDRFWQASTVPGSTRRLGFDGASPDGSGATGDVLGPTAVGHTGFTGTSVWLDPYAAGGARSFVLLTNRVHPVRDNDAIKALRPRFHRAAAAL
jgi:serine-type D-Ala-D-Ala carboxypeptidase